MSGVCLDAINETGRPDPEDIKAAGADGARLVARDDPAFFAYMDRLEEADLVTAVVIARESCADDDYGGWASFYAERCTPDYWVLGNEMDAGLLDAESDSSWKMTPEEYAAFWQSCAPAILDRQPDANLVVGGLVSGQPSWAFEVKRLLFVPPDCWDIHAYGKDATEARALMQAYRVALGGEPRLLELEWHRDADEIGEYEAMLADTVEWACFFCWHDGMVFPFGLYDRYGEEKPSYTAFCEAQEATEMAEPNEDTKKTMAEFENAGGVVGTVYTVDRVGEFEVTSTDAGLFVWRDGIPGAQIILDARANNPFE